MIKKVQEPAGTGGGKQDSPAKRGKCRNNLLSAHGRTEDGMCFVEKVMKFRGKGDNRQVQLKWTKGGYSWETFVPPYENLRKEVGQPVNVFGSLYEPYSNQ